MNWATEGFTEAGISVRDLGAWEGFLTRLGGWEVLYRGETPAPTRAAWPGQRETRVREMLLGRPGVRTGRIRLFRFDGVDQVEIRGGASSWDTGGIFDLDARVASVADLRGNMRQEAWDEISAPVEWSFGELKICEWLALGPEAVVMALIQRLHPPLLSGLPKGGIGHVFNSSQTVRDIERSMGFYRQLGFQVVVKHSGPLQGRGGEVLGLSPADAPRTQVELVIMSPDGRMEGSVELVALPGRPGRDLSALALPHQLGLNLLRFPVSGIDGFAAHLRDIGLASDASVFDTILAPHGAIRQVNLSSPDGAWLEFYEGSS